MLKILFADDEPSIRLSVGDVLRGAGHEVTIAKDGSEALAAIDKEVFDVMVTDVRMPKADGITLFRRVRDRAPQTDVILITAYGDVADAVAVLKEGAYDYLTKPFHNEELLLRIDRINERRTLRADLEKARAALRERGPDITIIGQSPPIVRLLQRLETIAQSDASVVITGESGTGKELVARALHARSSRASKAFVAVNCSAFPETLIEAELFGHERGAFTGAVRKRDGRFKAADGGTLLLDEIGEIPAPVQAKLLRVLQEGQVEPLGTNTAVQVNVRLICATHRNLKQLIAEGKFRDDLYYRLNVLDIHVPPLRERRGDLPILVAHFLVKFGRPDGPRPAISPAAWAALAEHPFPGNVRELEHAIQHAVALSGANEIGIEHLPQDIAGNRRSDSGPAAGAVQPLADAVKTFEREYLLRALDVSGGKRTQAAELLGISRKNLWEKLKSHHISAAELENGE